MLTAPTSKELNSIVLDLKYFGKGNIKCDRDGNNETSVYKNEQKRKLDVKKELRKLAI